MVKVYLELMVNNKESEILCIKSSEVKAKAKTWDETPSENY